MIAASVYHPVVRLVLILHQGESGVTVRRISLSKHPPPHILQYAVEQSQLSQHQVPQGEYWPPEDPLVKGVTCLVLLLGMLLALLNPLPGGPRACSLSCPQEARHEGGQVDAQAMRSPLLEHCIS